MSRRHPGALGLLAEAGGLALGAWELVRLGWVTRFRLRGRWWRWRLETAFGADPRRWPPRRQRILAALEYGRWVRRMRRGA